MRSCREHERALYERAAKTLTAAEATGLEAHLARCAACREEAERIEEAVELAKVPWLEPMSSEGREQELALSTLSRFRRGQRRRVAAALGAGVLGLVGAAAVITPALDSRVRRAVAGVADRVRGDLGAPAGASLAGPGASAALGASDETSSTAAEELAQAALDAAGEITAPGEEEDL